MNFVVVLLTHLYAKLLLLYPGSFQDEFAEEMQVVFRDLLDESIEGGPLSVALVCLRELGGLPINILREFRHEFERKEINMITNEQVDQESITEEEASHRHAFIGALPFALFGIASMVGTISIPFLGIYADLAFYGIVLLGLMVGLIKGVPRWTYSYLGWSLVFAWWWSNMGTHGLKILGVQINYWTWQIWTPLFAIIGIALLWTRSLHPLRQLIHNIWQDWTLLSFAMYTFAGWMALIYDENHHPYLFAFMIGSTLAVSGGAWFFLRGRKTRNRVIALLSGFMTVAIIGAISDATWDWHAYYGIPEPPSVAWYVSALRIILILLFWGLILFWPALVGFARRQQP